MDVGVMFLFGMPEHAYIICDADGAWALFYDEIHPFLEHVLDQVQAEW